jgi:hypothetical protein
MVMERLSFGSILMVDQPDTNENLDGIPPSRGIEEVRDVALRQIDLLLASVAESKRHVLEMTQRIAESKRRDWETWAGAVLPKMLASKDASVCYLHHENPCLRKAAIALLLDHWCCVPEFASTLRRLAVEDPDPTVQEMSLIVMGSSSSGLRSPSLARFFSRIVLDERMASKVRLCAYNLLFQIDGLPSSSWPTIRALRGQFVFPDDVDWAFVNRSCHSLSGNDE